jgi:hypothetical protein
VLLKIIFSLSCILIVLFLYFVFSKNLHFWLWSYCKELVVMFFQPKHKGLVHIVFCFVDHYEPKWENPPKEVEKKRVDLWCHEYPKIAKKHTDSDGKYPQHTWFYPAEEYEAEYLEKLSALCSKGFGEIELHLHHHDDTSAGVTKKINDAINNFKKHGAFETIEGPGKIVYGFIHGNWALDNSHKRGIQCGVNDEISLLNKTGCYADFTLPSAPSSCQTSKINSIYYAFDDSAKPKSHDIGIDVQVGKEVPDADLMIIQGPLSLNWKNRKYGLLPRIENGEVSGGNPATPDRIDSWVRQHIHVKGRKDWLFVKVHCHGSQEKDRDVLLGDGFDEMLYYLEKQYNDGVRYKLHYVTARECYNIIKAAEADEGGEPGEYRDYIIKKYINSSKNTPC